MGSADRPSAAERGMQLGLRALNRLAGAELLDRLGLRGPAERTLRRVTSGTARAATRAGRTFATVRRQGPPGRPSTARAPGLFDLTPTDEQRLMQDSFREFAGARLRPAALDADAACAAPGEVLAQAGELGLALLAVPEDLGGIAEERSAVTSALIAEALAHGDMGLAVAALAPAAVSTALSLWGDAGQQATYLPEFTGEEPPIAALAVMEHGAQFDPLAPQAAARRVADGFVLDGVKALVPRAADAELFVVSARLDERPALFVVESGTKGLTVEPEPAMGIRAAATATLELEGVAAPATALLADGDPDAHAECVALGRVAWSALAVGTAQAVLDYVVPYVNEREAFGEPISHRQAVAFGVADIAIELEGMRLAAYRAAARADQGTPFRAEAARARRLCARHAMAIGSAGVQLLGGHGYVKEHPVERWYRDLRAAGLMEGTLLV